MDKITKNYRLAQISKVKNGDYTYNPTIKIHGSIEGNTHCLDISKKEFIAICKILTENKF